MRLSPLLKQEKGFRITTLQNCNSKNSPRTQIFKSFCKAISATRSCSEAECRLDLTFPSTEISKFDSFIALSRASNCCSSGKGITSLVLDCRKTINSYKRAMTASILESNLLSNIRPYFFIMERLRLKSMLSWVTFSTSSILRGYPKVDIKSWSCFVESKNLLKMFASRACYLSFSKRRLYS